MCKHCLFQNIVHHSNLIINLNQHQSEGVPCWPKAFPLILQVEQQAVSIQYTICFLENKNQLSYSIIHSYITHPHEIQHLQNNLELGNVISGLKQIRLGSIFSRGIFLYDYYDSIRCANVKCKWFRTNWMCTWPMGSRVIKSFALLLRLRTQLWLLLVWRV